MKIMRVKQPDGSIVDIPIGPGIDGKSVSITNIKESPDEDGINEVYFSDGSILKVKNGSQGEDGTDGVGITKIEQTTTSTESGGNNIVTVTLTDGRSSTFNILNGKDGTDGEKGDPYTLTDADKRSIAEEVYSMIADGNEVAY
jgi:hypothetical protein